MQGSEDFTHIDLTIEHNEPTNNDVAETQAAQAPETPAVESAVIEDVPETKQEPGNQSEPQKEALPMTAKQMAKFTVGLINVGMSAGVPQLQFRSEFTDKEAELIDLIQMGRDVPNNDFTNATQRKYMQFLRKMEEIPLTDAETKTYTEAWEKCFIKWDIQMTPETALLVSTLTIVGSRFMPVIGNKLQNLFSR